MGDVDISGIVERLSELESELRDVSDFLRSGDILLKSDLEVALNEVLEKLRDLGSSLEKAFKSDLKSWGDVIKSKLGLLGDSLNTLMGSVNLVSDKIDTGINKLNESLALIREIMDYLRGFKNYLESKFDYIDGKVSDLEDRLDGIVSRMSYNVIVTEIDDDGSLKKIVKPTNLLIGKRYLILYKGGLGDAKIRFKGKIKDIIQGVDGSEVIMDRLSDSNFLKKEVKLRIPGSTWIRYFRNFYHIFIGVSGCIEIISGDKIDALLPLRAYTRGTEMLVTFLAIVAMSFLVYNYINSFMKSYLPLLVSFGLFLFTFLMGILTMKIMRGD